jgi:hypothetical protein
VHVVGYPGGHPPCHAISLGRGTPYGVDRTAKFDVIVANKLNYVFRAFLGPRESSVNLVLCRNCAGAALRIAGSEGKDK